MSEYSESELFIIKHYSNVFQINVRTAHSLDKQRAHVTNVMLGKLRFGAGLSGSQTITL